MSLYLWLASPHPHLSCGDAVGPPMVEESRFSLNHTVGQGKKVEHLGTTLSPKNCLGSFKVQLSVTLPKSSDDPLFLTSLLIELAVTSSAV